MAAEPGIVIPEHLYAEPVAQRIMGWGRHALTEAKKRGLKPMKSGKRNYYLGRDLIAYVVADSSKPQGIEA